MHEKNKKIPSGAEECVEAYRAGSEKTDPQGSWTGNPEDCPNPDDCPNPRAVSGGSYLHDAFPFVPGVFAGTELYGAEMMCDPGLLSTGIWSPNEDALLREKDKRSSGGRNAEFTASRPAEFTAGLRSEMPVSDREEIAGNEMKPVQDADDL